MSRMIDIEWNESEWFVGWLKLARNEGTKKVIE